MKEIMEWIYGPQIIGAIFLLFGFIQKAWPPKKINGYYGYNSPLAQTSPEVWAEANRYAPLVMIRMGLGIIFAGLLIMTIAKFVPAFSNLWTQIGMFGVMAAAFAGGLIMRNRTERHLKQRFDIVE